MPRLMSLGTISSFSRKWTKGLISDSPSVGWLLQRISMYIILSAVNLSGLQYPLNSEICHRCSNSPAAAPHPPPASATMASSPQIAQPSASTPSQPTQDHQRARASKLSPQESPTTPDTSDYHRCCKSAKSSYDPSRWCRFWQTL